MNYERLKRLYGIKFSGDIFTTGILCKNQEQIKEVIIDTFSSRYQDFRQLIQDSIQVNLTKLNFKFMCKQFDQINKHVGSLRLFYYVQ